MRLLRLPVSLLLQNGKFIPLAVANGKKSISLLPWPSNRRYYSWTNQPIIWTQNISEMSNGFVSRVSDVCSVGDEMKVLVIDIDDHDRVKLSRRRALEELGLEDEIAKNSEGGEEGGERSERGERSGGLPSKHAAGPPPSDRPCSACTPRTSGWSCGTW